MTVRSYIHQGWRFSKSGTSGTYQAHSHKLLFALSSYFYRSNRRRYRLIFICLIAAAAGTTPEAFPLTHYHHQGLYNFTIGC